MSLSWSGLRAYLRPCLMQSFFGKSPSTKNSAASAGRTEPISIRTFSTRRLRALLFRDGPPLYRPDRLEAAATPGAHALRSERRRAGDALAPGSIINWPRPTKAAARPASGTVLAGPRLRCNRVGGCEDEAARRLVLVRLERQRQLLASTVAVGDHQGQFISRRQLVGQHDIDLSQADKGRRQAGEQNLNRDVADGDCRRHCRY